MKRILSLLLLLFATALGAQELSITDAHAPATAPFAQPFVIEYQLSHTPGYSVVVDDKSLSTDFEIQQVTSTDNSPGTTAYNFTVIPFVLGRSTFTVTFEIKLDDKTISAAADPSYINVTPVEVFKDKKLREIRPPFIPAGWLTWLLVLLLILAIIYVIYWWKKQLQQKRQLRISQAQDTRPSHVIALSKINALVQSGLWEKGQYKLFYITLIDILREYLQRRFQLDVSADTSAELLLRIKNKQTLQPFLPLLRELLTQSDLVKFARVIPSEEQRNGNIRLLCTFVEETTPKPQPAAEDKK